MATREISDQRLLLTQAILHVDGGSGALQDTKGLDHGRRHTILRLVDVEVAERAEHPDSSCQPFVCYRAFNWEGRLTAESGHPSTCRREPNHHNRADVSIAMEKNILLGGATLLDVHLGSLPGSRQRHRFQCGEQ